MKTKIWLDDVRPAPSDEYMWVKTVGMAIMCIVSNAFTHISFDHDLGTELTGYDLAKWMEENSATDYIRLMTWDVHSANPVGRANIEAAMKNYERFCKERRARYGYK